MSPHMKKSLLDTTNHLLQRLSNPKTHRREIVYITERFNKNWPSGFRYRVFHEPHLRAGFLEVLELISHRLEKDIIPRIDTLSGRPPPRIDFKKGNYQMGMSGKMWKFYREAGGVESTLRTVFELAMDRDGVVGDGSFERARAWEGKELAMECRNDLEYGFVANICGVLGLMKNERDGKGKGRECGGDEERDGYFSTCGDLIQKALS